MAAAVAGLSSGEVGTAQGPLRVCPENPRHFTDGSGRAVYLSAATGELAVEWMHPVEGALTPGEPTTGGARRTLQAPFDGDAVLHIRREQCAPSC